MEIFTPYIDSEADQVYESPFIRVAHELGEFVLDHLNSRIRYFPLEYKDYNHIEFMPDPESQIIGVEANEELIQLLLDNDWSSLYLPFVDTQTKNWYDHCQSKKMFQELGNLGLSFEI
jgi:hypothetical protein